MVKVLIADDDKNLRKVLVNELSDHGFDVDAAEDGIKTMDLLEKDEYDVLLLDLNMPGLGGMDVLKKIKDIEIPLEIIILTAHATVPTAVKAMQLGAYDYITKPFQTEELTAVIEKAYEKKKLLKSIEDVLEYVDQMEEVKTDGVSPCFTVNETLKNVMREDIPEAPLSRDLFLADAPSHVGGMIRVPPVLKQ